MEEAWVSIVLILGGLAPTRTMLRFLLERDGCTVIEVSAHGSPASIGELGRVALAIIVAEAPDDRSLQAVGHLRRNGYRARIAVLAGDTSPDFRRRAFGQGAREVIPFPLEAADLQRRLRRALQLDALDTISRARAERIHAGGLTLHTAGREVSDGRGWSARLTRQETALLGALMRAPGQFMGHEELGAAIWGAGVPGSDNTLAALVSRLRRKLARSGAADAYLRTVSGRGYAFEARSALRRREDASPPSQPQVLVVEDDRPTAAMVADVLHRAGYAVTCGAGPDGPRLARQIDPSVILLDIDMPGMSGVEVRRHLRASARTAQIPVIAFSAGRNLRAYAAAMVADDYLAKPFSVDDLLLRIEKWAGSPGAE